MRQSAYAITGIKKEFWGQALRELRLSQDFSLTELARAANCTKSNLSAIENGANWPTSLIISAYEQSLNLEAGAVQSFASVLSSDSEKKFSKATLAQYIKSFSKSQISKDRQALTGEDNLSDLENYRENRVATFTEPAAEGADANYDGSFKVDFGDEDDQEASLKSGLSEDNRYKLIRQDFTLQLAQAAFENGKFEELKSLLAELKPRTLKGRNKGRYYYLLGLQEIEARDFKTARADLNEAWSVFNTLPEGIFEPLDKARVKNALGTSFYREGNYHQATLEHESCLEGIENGSLHDAAFQMELYYKLGCDYHMAGKNTQAIQFLNRALEMAAQFPNWRDRLGVYWSMALAYRSEKDLSRAKYYLKLSADGYQQLNNLRFASVLNGMLGLIMIERKEYATAAPVLYSALDEAKELKDDELIGKSYINLAYLQNEEGRYQEAAENARRAVEKVSQSSDKLLQAQAYRQWADIEINLNHLAESLALYEQALAAVEESTSQEYLNRILYGYAGALAKAGETTKALEMYQRTDRYKN